MMKREWAALAVLAVLIAASIWNIRQIDTLTDEIGIALCKSKSATEQLNFKSSRKIIEEGLEIWQESEKYTRVFLTETQVDSTTLAFYELMESLSQEDLSSCFPAYEKLEYLLEGLYKSERISVGSVF